MPILNHENPILQLASYKYLAHDLRCLAKRPLMTLGTRDLIRYAADTIDHLIDCAREELYEQDGGREDAHDS